MSAAPKSPPASGQAMSQDEARSRRARNIAIALALVAFIALIYAVTIARLANGAGLPGSAG